EAADVLAPAPKVDEEPSATILIGSPLTRRRAVRGSARSKRTCSAATVHAGGRGAVAEDGSAAGVTIKPGVCARAGSSANKPAVATAPKTAARRKKIWRSMMCVSSLWKFFPVLRLFLLTRF